MVRWPLANDLSLLDSTLRWERLFRDRVDVMVAEAAGWREVADRIAEDHAREPAINSLSDRSDVNATTCARLAACLCPKPVGQFTCADTG
jgi:hypothetical protein